MRLLKNVDWWDLSGMFLIYSLLVSVVFSIIYRSNITAVEICMGLAVFFLVVLKQGGKKFKWALVSSYFLWFIIFAAIGTPFYAAWQQRKKLFKGG